ncbi:MAG: LysR family transcriptional regulator [Chromatiales bacterium]|nr:LysR family transcriptional regulator [Chromatiales bacterium]
MSFKMLRYIVAAARTGHFGQAARLCNVTQPSLSEQIKKLEEYLDIRIFERTRSGVEVTEPGRRIVAMAEEALVIERCIKAASPRFNEDCPYAW